MIKNLTLLYFVIEVPFLVLIVIYQLLSIRNLCLHALTHNLTLLYLRGDLLAELVSLPEQLLTELHLLLLSHFRR